MSDFVRSSEVDLIEAYRCGVEAVKLAEKGESGLWLVLRELQTTHIPLNLVKFR